MMPEIGRWGVVDKLTDYYESSSPYTYALNDPVNAIDPDGNLIVFVNGFMPDQYLQQDDRKTVVNYINPNGAYTLGSNPNYRPYPGERNLSNDAPTYLGQPFSYWGNETDESIGNIQSGIGGLFSQGHNDYNVLFTSASNDPLSSAKKRFNEGMKAGEDLINQLESGEQFLADGETIKIVGHSQGAAYAAGMATFIAKHSKYSSRLEVVYYLAPDQPNQFRHPDGVDGIQFSTENDRVSSKNLAMFHNSYYSRIQGVNKAYGRKYNRGGRGGHYVNTYLDEVATYFRNLGINVTVYE